jgi:hypothetical protein
MRRRGVQRGENLAGSAVVVSAGVPPRHHCCFCRHAVGSMGVSFLEFSLMARECEFVAVA